tara:strand:+ start:47 stop:259 length:213 start_codon:yes stop_codon:yes gene_type:complete
MSKAISEIQKRTSKINSLIGSGFCGCVDSLDKDATELEWINAWNTDQHIIMGAINDIELACGEIDLEDYS